MPAQKKNVMAQSARALFRPNHPWIVQLVRWMIVSLILLSPTSRPQAGAPIQADGAPRPSKPPARIPSLTAGDNGPYFSLSDLKRLPPLQKLLSSQIKPPPSMEYPPVLEGIPIAARAYTTQTVTYLAEHEIRYGDRKSEYVALTFDCEVGTNNVLYILDTLREAQAHATFFMLGKYVYMYPDLTRQIVQDGHELGSHSFFHPLFYEISPITATQEIHYTEAAITWAVGETVPMRYFRFPYGGRSDEWRRHVASLGYQSAFWDLDPRGWEPDVTAEDVVAYIQNTVHGGAIIIMHCGCVDDANALPGILRAIQDKGLLPGTLSDVLTAADRNIPNYVVPGTSPSPP